MGFDMKKIKFYRNEDVYTPYENNSAIDVAKTAIESLEDVSDGEIILARYQESQQSDIQTLLCVYYSDGTNGGWTFIEDVNGKLSTIYQSLSSIDGIIENNEYVTALALTDLDERVDTLENTNFGTITGITMNGESKGTSGVVDLGTVATSDTQKVFMKFSVSGDAFSFTDFDGNTIGQTQVKTVMSDPTKEPYFIDVENNIYTLFNYTDSESFSIFHIDDTIFHRIAIFWDETYSAYLLDEELNVRLFTNFDDIDIIEAHFPELVKVGRVRRVSKTASASVTIDPYVMNDFGTVSRSMTIAFNTAKEINGYTKEYTLRFVAGNGCAITLPSGVLYANGVTPTYTSGHTYEISVVNNCVVVGEFY